LPIAEVKRAPQAGVVIEMITGNRATIELEVAQLLVNTLQLEVKAEDIAPDEPLFGEGLGLDSIDALEIALAISRTYGFELSSEDGRTHQVFASLHHLTRYIDAHRTK
jgi:acyl carrier protein